MSDRAICELLLTALLLLSQHPLQVFVDAQPGHELSPSIASLCPDGQLKDTRPPWALYVKIRLPAQ
jgi:hypothetical protein